MATFRAIAAASEAVIRLLQSSYDSAFFDGNELEFRVFNAQDFTGPSMQAGVSVFVYRVMPEGTQRTPAGRMGPDGKRRRTQLPLEVHFLLTAWAQDPSLQNTIAGWMMRVLEDTPTLPAGLLNAVWADVFRPDESLEIVFGDLSTEDLFHVWDVLADRGYQLSVPYVARVIRIESALDQSAGTPVTERSLGFGSLQADDSDGDRKP